MKSPHIQYDLLKSVERLDKILSQRDDKFPELDNIPDRKSLTYSSGAYVLCSSIFFDIVGSSELPSKHKRPRLAKIYRSFISESVAVFNGNELCREVNINGDCVWGVFNTPFKRDIDSVFSTAAQLNSLCHVLNCRFQRAGIPPIEAGIGISYGRALMIKVGAFGSGVNEVVWMGEVVNDASNLCSLAIRHSAEPIVVSAGFYDNLSDPNKRLLSSNYSEGCYQGDVVNVEMSDWYQSNCTK